MGSHWPGAVQYPGSWPQSFQVRPPLNDSYVPALKKYFGRLWYILEPATRWLWLSGSIAIDGSECEMYLSCEAR